MEFQLTINMDNAAFDDDLGGELARIVRHVARRLEDDSVTGDLLSKCSVRDANGNTVGSWEVTA